MKSDQYYNSDKIKAVNGIALRPSGGKRVVRIVLVSVLTAVFACFGSENLLSQNQALRSGGQSISSYSESASAGSLTDYLKELEQTPVKSPKISRAGSSFSASGSATSMPLVSVSETEELPINSMPLSLPLLLLDEEQEERIVEKESPATMPVVVAPDVAIPAKEQVFSNYQSPVIDIRTSGPQRIVVGQESEYLIHVRNIGGSSAQGLVVTTDIPNGVEVLGIRASNGSAQIVQLPISATTLTDGSGQKCRWQLNALASQKEEVLRLSLVPRQKVYFELTSQYELAINPIRAGVQVDEAILTVGINGDETILWGTEQQYQLVIQNTGNATAENLILMVSTGEGQEATQPLGNLSPGEERAIDLAMQTEQTGHITIGAKVQGAYGVEAAQSREVAVLRGHLELSIEAPELQFVENEIDCIVHVTNTGSAPVSNGIVRVRLPREPELSVDSEGIYQLNADEWAWNFSSVAVGEEIVYRLSCRSKTPGMVAVQINAADDTGLMVSAGAQIQLDAIARLHVELKSPTTPVALGTPFVYEVILTNQGSKSAQKIQSSLMLAHSIEAIGVEGGGSIVPHSNEVQFNEISFLAPGQSAVFKVEVVSHETGNLKAQAIMESVSESIRLANEAVVYCYEKRNVAGAGGNTEKLALGPALPNSTATAPKQTVVGTSTNHKITRTAEQLIEQGSKPKAEPASFPISSTEAVQVNKIPSKPVTELPELPALPELQPMPSQQKRATPISKPTPAMNHPAVGSPTTIATPVSSTAPNAIMPISTPGAVATSGRQQPKNNGITPLFGSPPRIVESPPSQNNQGTLGRF